MFLIVFYLCYILFHFCKYFYLQAWPREGLVLLLFHTGDCKTGSLWRGEGHILDTLKTLKEKATSDLVTDIILEQGLMLDCCAQNLLPLDLTTGSSLSLQIAFSQTISLSDSYHNSHS